MWIAKVVRHGNCVAVMLPKAARMSARLARGDYVFIRYVGATELVLDRIDPADLPRLRDKVAGKDEDLR